jgi:hypothetical protein
MTRNSLGSLMVLLLVGCGGAEDVTGPWGVATDAPFDTARVVPVPPQVARLELDRRAQRLNVVGLDHTMLLTAYDGSGNRVDAGAVALRSSDESVAHVSLSIPYGTYDCDSSSGLCKMVWSRWIGVRTIGVGRATITASLGDATDSVTIVAHPLPTAPTDLVVDSFKVVEYDPGCAWACPYRAYAPLVWMHQPVGASVEFLEAVEVSIPGHSTGWCRHDGSPLTPGVTSIRINAALDPYLWNNDFIMVSLRGPVPDGLATLRVIVSDSLGDLRIVHAAAPIERSGQVPMGVPNTATGCGG